MLLRLTDRLARSGDRLRDHIGWESVSGERTGPERYPPIHDVGVDAMSRITGAHLVGSAPVGEPAEMFDLAVSHLRHHLRRIGDGEVGQRDTWIRWQYAKLGQSPQLESTHVDDGYLGRAIEQYVVVDGSGPVELVDLGYAQAAIDSYATFSRLKASGAIPGHVRFMVGLPTPLGVVTLYVAPGSRESVLDAYHEAMVGQLERVLVEIPAAQLAIQWEVCIEFGTLENIWTQLDSDARGVAARPGIAAHIVELGDLVPEGVELGYHLCYGDAGHEHFTQPRDAGHLAWAIRELLAGVRRRIDWIHLPVPRERDDVPYFEPLGTIDLPDETELYLGLVHETGGVEGTRARIEAASQVVARFGVATECGLGRRSRTSIPALFDQHAEVSEAII